MSQFKIRHTLDDFVIELLIAKLIKYLSKQAFPPVMSRAESVVRCNPKVSLVVDSGTVSQLPI